MPPLSRPFGLPASSRRRARWSLAPVVCALALPGMLFVSCASRGHRQAAASSGETLPTLIPIETRVGAVRAIGPDQRFVLIETPSALATQALSEGQLLHCRPPGSVGSVATADLRVSRERHQALIVANVVAGEPAIGALVYFTPDAHPTPTPAASPGSVSSVSTAPLPGLFGPRPP